MNYVNGAVLRSLREKKGYTQKQLAERLCVSDKAISKWENEKGLPDVSMLEPLAKELQISVAELLSGEPVLNENRSANLLRSRFYVCPICANIVYALGKGVFSCCGISLPALEAEPMTEEHSVVLEAVEDEFFISMDHEMSKSHYLSFFAFVGSGNCQIVKLYPEQNPTARLKIRGHGLLYAYCNRHGLFVTKV